MVSQVISVASVLLLALTVPAAGAQLITPDEAKAAVRAFENSPSLQFGTVNLEEDADGPEWQHTHDYLVDIAGSPDPTWSWSVNAVTGEVNTAIYGDAIPDDCMDESPGPRSKEQCRQIAEGFARSKYSGFDTANMHLTGGIWIGTGWEFEWCQKLAHDAWGVSAVSVQVSPVNGRIQVYRSTRLDLPIPAEPQITAEHAVDAAKVATGIANPASVEEPVLTADPDGVYWHLVIDGLDAQAKRRNVSVTLNAVTGEIISQSDAVIAPPGRPAERRNDGLVWVRELIRTRKDTQVQWLGHSEAQITVGSESYRLRVGSCAAIGTRGTVPLSGKVTLRDGQLMVPADLLPTLGGHRPIPPPRKASGNTR